MNCEICLEPFDHSIHKPHHLECSHTYCLSCLKILTNNKYPNPINYSFKKILLASGNE